MKQQSALSESASPHFWTKLLTKASVAVAALALDKIPVCSRQVKVLAQVRFAEGDGYLLVVLAFGRGEEGQIMRWGVGQKATAS